MTANSRPTLLVLRHAPTDWNAEGRVQGRSDRPLSTAGRAQAAGWRLPEGAAAWRWLSSPLLRARETAQILSLSSEAEPRLVEMSWGAWEGCRLAELRESGRLSAVEEARGLDFRPPDGESPRDVQERLRPLLAALAAAGKPVGAVTHKGVIRSLYALATGWDMVSDAPHRLRPACAHRFTLAADGTPAVLELNIPLEPGPETTPDASR